MPHAERLGRRRLIVVVPVLLALVTAWPARAERVVTVGTTAESWYVTTPAVPAPPVTGLPAAPATPAASPYPAGTLHVGVTAGQEDSRSYLALDLGAVGGDEITGGRLVLPVSPDGGTRSPETAQLRICRADDAGDDARGSTGPPPGVECTIGAPATYVADRGAFEVDLGPLVGFLDDALAVVPVVAAPESTWHVAFHASDSEVADAARIEATLTLADDEVAAGPIVTASPPLESTAFASTLHPESAVAVSAPDVGIGQFSAPTRAAVSPPAVAQTPAGTAAAPGQQATPIALAGTEGFRYSIVFALPLLVLVGVPYFGYALTGPVTGQRRRDRRALNRS